VPFREIKSILDSYTFFFQKTVILWLDFDGTREFSLRPKTALTLDLHYVSGF